MRFLDRILFAVTLGACVFSVMLPDKIAAGLFAFSCAMALTNILNTKPRE